MATENRLGFSLIVDDRPEFLRDLLALRPLSPEKLAERVSQIKEKMKEHQSEFFLAVRREWYPPGCTDFGYQPKHGDYIMMVETVFMGLCTEPYLTVQDHYLELHTPDYAWPYPMGIYKEKGSLNKPAYELERPLPKTRGGWEDPGLALEIFVGDEEVSSWFLTHYGGKEILVYPKMAAMLGRPLPELPEPIQEVIHQRKQEIVENLLSLVEEDEKLAAQIKRIYQTLEKGDAFFATWGQREKLEETRRRIKQILTEALELDMHQGKEILRKEIRPGQTVEIDIARFIQEFCGYYKIPIPHDSG